MSAQEMIAELPSLSDAEREQVAKALQEMAATREIIGDAPDEFDDPLPDSFWLGEDA